MRFWYQKPLGRSLLKAERAGLDKILPRLFGYYLLQIGDTLDSDLLSSSPIHTKIVLDKEKSTCTNQNFIQANYTELPFLPESLDAVIYFHILEFSSNPLELLLETYKTIIPGGYIIVFGFNPHSLWQLSRICIKEAEPPWNGQFISPWKMRRLLTRSGFHAGDYETFFFRPPIENEQGLKKLLFLESLGQICWPYFGASYMFLAQKRVAEPTLLKMKKLERNLQVATSIPKPTSRNQT
ncbi:MAG: class I SAM-dependent methyltransferase [Gammaproteobacteria bacterium]|nr:class I SAM-dependent methyltransferase [Gammaproteobacteria bacterium]